MSTPLRRFSTPVLGALALVAGGVLLLAALSLQASAAVNHGVIVPEVPRTDVPVVLDGKVRAHAQVGNRIFVGGDFQQVELIDGTVITQPYLFAYDIDTGILDPNFRPVLNKLVRALEPTPAGDGLYVGGLFTSWDASFPIRIAKLDALGNLDPTFSATADARVQSIAARADTVFIGGDFNSVSGVARRGLAALDAQTGAVDTGFSVDIGSSINGSQLVKTIVLTSDGTTLFAMHYGSTIGGQVREAVAKIDVSGPTASLTGWNVPWSAQAGNRLCWKNLRDMAISPDDSFIVIGGQGADNPPNCDSVLKYDTAGTSTVNFTWSARMYSSVFSLAVTDVAVYVGGHFCAAPKNPIPLGGVSSTWPGSANQCDINNPTNPVNPSEKDPDNAVFRKQMAALDPITGQALPWDPGSNNFVGVFDLTVIDRGLLAGHDLDRFNDILTGRSGFFDLGAGGPDTTPPTMDATSPAPGAVVTDPSELRGTATDNFEIAAVTLRLKNITTGLWLQPDGTFAATQADLPPNLTVTGLGAVEWDYPVAGLPDGDYEIRGFSTDTSGNTSTPLVSPFLIPGAATCTVALDGDDQPVLTWSGFTDGTVTTVFLRRDGSWLANGAAGSSTYTDTTAAPGDHSYLIRWRPGGVVTDVPCTPDPITVPQGGAPTCTVVLDANSKPLLTWDSVAGVSNYNVRDETGWVATVTGATTYTDDGATPGDHSYVVRYNQGGPVDIPCMPDPITVPAGAGLTCTVELVAGDVVVDWTAVPGEDTYQVRDALTGWIATVVNELTYTDTDPEPGARTYVVRYRQGGQSIDTICTPDPINV